MSAAGATGEDRLSLMILRSVTEVPVPLRGVRSGSDWVTIRAFF